MKADFALGNDPSSLSQRHTGILPARTFARASWRLLRAVPRNGYVAAALPCSKSAECERDQRVGEDVAVLIAAASGDHHKLLAGLLPKVGGRSSVGTRWQ